MPFCSEKVIKLHMAIKVFIQDAFDKLELADMTGNSTKEINMTQFTSQLVKTYDKIVCIRAKNRTERNVGIPGESLF